MGFRELSSWNRVLKTPLQSFLRTLELRGNGASLRQVWNDWLFFVQGYRRMSISKLFRKKSSVNSERTTDSNIRHTVAMFSRGNVNLQNGMFITREDLENVRRKNLAHDFTKSK